MYQGRDAFDPKPVSVTEKNAFNLSLFWREGKLVFILQNLCHDWTMQSE